jgi:DNA (cytosine-5)-methyltransferase 1
MVGAHGSDQAGGGVRLLDLFCGAGGAAMGYSRVGFTEIVGVDIEPQPRYPFDFVRGDALEYLAAHGREFDAVHASPPCQAYSVLAFFHPGRTWPDLIPATRAALEIAGVPWVIENVEGAPLMRGPGLFNRHGIRLCGTAFGLGVDAGELRRHRLFESNVPLFGPPCRHRRRTVGVYGHGGMVGKHRMLCRRDAALALGIDWMNRDEMTQAIPPAYTQFIGEQIMEHLGRARVKASST